MTLSSASASIFLPGLGFEDDVDVVVAWNGEFAVICEENETGTSARVRILDLNAATGLPVAIPFERAVMGFEHAVDAIAPNPIIGGLGTPVAVPVESEDGAHAGVLLLRVSDTGTVLEERFIDLGNLGFRADVDAAVAPYPNLMGFFALESRDHSATGVLGIDLNPADAAPPGNAFGTCVLLSSDGRPGCMGPPIDVDWLPGLADGVDPVAYRTPSSVRLVLPVTSWAGSDLLLLDFDNTMEPPMFLGHSSVKEINETTARPTNFPGFEWDVDMAQFAMGQCGLAQASILVPVEGPGGVGDLYLLDEDGNSIWTYSHDGGGPPIPGYEAGVDLVPMCDLPGGAAPRVAVAVENAAGTDADLFLVRLDTGALLARAEDPAVNPGLTIRGYEKGVEPVRWTADYLLLALEDNAGTGELMTLSNGGVLMDSRVVPGDMSFQVSMDPIVAALPDADRTLFVPLMKPNGDDADLVIFRSPPSLHVGATSLEVLNPGIQVSQFERDVDLGLVEKNVSGGEYMFLPEEDPAGVNARLRFEAVPTAGRYLAMATLRRGGLPPTLYFVRVSNGLVVSMFTDLFGLEPGLDMGNGRGSVTPGNPPASGVTPGYDADTDPTLVWIDESVGVPEGHAGVPNSLRWLRHPNPFTAPGEIRYSLLESGLVRVGISDAAGRTVRHLFDGFQRSGERTVSWDGRDEKAARVPAGVYFLQIRGARDLKVSKLILIQ